MTLIVDNSAPSGSAPARRTYTRSRRSYGRRRGYTRRARFGKYSRGRYSTYINRRLRWMKRTRKRRMSKFRLANIDPFMDQAQGAKIPDSNNYPSTGFTVDDSFTHSADANGLTAFVALPNLKVMKVGHVAATSSTWTWTAAYGGSASSSKLTSVKNNYTLVRPVAHGIRLMCPYAPTNVTGNVHMCIVATSDFNKPTWDFPLSITDMQNCSDYRRYPLASLTQQGVTVVNKFIDCTSQRYFDPDSDLIDNSTDIAFQTNGWAAICVAVEGAVPSAVALSVEQRVLFEGIPLKTGIDTASPAAPYDVNELEATSRTAGAIPGAFADNERQDYLSQVSAAMNSGVRAAAENGFENIVLPAAYAFGGYAANRALHGIAGVTNRGQFGLLS
nr:MAG: putative capsid protein [Arizlama virus]